MNASERSGVIRFADAQASIPTPTGARATAVFQLGTLDVALSLPVHPNIQTPHTQDELYFVVRGRGALIHEGQRDAFQAGDLLFVAAGCDHHYEDFSTDLALWRMFYGPHGGEVPP